MKISDLGEFGLIEKIRKSRIPASPSVVVGIGDDAAALKVKSSTLLLATTDMLLEGVHFDLSYTDFYSLGWKSAAVNLSDIAAMGGVPRFCLVSLGIPPWVSVENVSDFYRGLTAVLRAHRTALVGGDTCSSRLGNAVNVVVLGEVTKTSILTRAKAEPGDRIFVTGMLGDSAAGLELLQKDVKRKTSGVKRLMQKHLRPVPRVEWGRMIARSGCASAMIDISDGLSSDLARICEESRVGAVIHTEKIPISPALRKLSSRSAKTPLAYALSGGEDYELLFTVSRRKLGKFRLMNIPASEIGEVSGTRGIYIADSTGKKKLLGSTGYDHFPRSRYRALKNSGGT